MHKMSEFSVDVPLAITEDFGDFQCSEDIENSNSSPAVNSNLTSNVTERQNKTNEKLDNNSFVEINSSFMDNNFTETFSNSLEDLVNTFDDKIVNCFRNYDENVSNLAPVQVRSQEEVINESQYVLISLSAIH